MQWRYFGIQFANFRVEGIFEEGSGDVWSFRYMSAALELGIPIEIFLLETGTGVGGENFEVRSKRRLRPRYLGWVETSCCKIYTTGGVNLTQVCRVSLKKIRGV